MAANDYRFDLVRENAGPLVDKSVLERRPFASRGSSFADDVRRFVPGQALTVAINTSIAVGEPLLITGEPGTGKTQAAFYAAWKLAIEPVIHFQVKSDSTRRTSSTISIRYGTFTMPRPGRTGPC